MATWRVEVETPEGAVPENAAPLDPFSHALDDDSMVSEVSATWDAAPGTVTATFTVEADRRDDAAWVAFWAYMHAAWAARIVLSAESRLEVSHADGDDAARFRARLDLAAG